MRILDLFCGAGGSAMGYHRAFPDAEIIGIDIKPQLTEAVPPAYTEHIGRALAAHLQEAEAA